MRIYILKFLQINKTEYPLSNSTATLRNRTTLVQESIVCVG